MLEHNSESFHRETIKILVIDDDAGILKLIKKKLEHVGYNIVTLSDVNQAVDVIRSENPQLLLLDYLYYDINCSDVIEKFVQEEIDLPFIIMTGHGDEKVAVEMMKLGAKDYLIKDAIFLEFLPAVVNRVCLQLVTENKLIDSEIALKESRERYFQLFNSSIDPVFFTQNNGMLEDFNNSFLELFNFHIEDIQKLTFKDLFLRTEDYLDFIAYLNLGNINIDFDTQLKNKNSVYITCLIRASYRYDRENNIIGIQGIIRDITKQKSNELEINNLNKDLEERVKRRTKELEIILMNLEQENNQHKITQSELSRAKEELANSLNTEKALNELKSHFISMVSHEYRSPLQVILSSVNLLEDYYIKNDSEAINKHIKKIKSAIEMLTHLLEEVIIIGKADNGKLNIKRESINIVDFLQKIIEDVRIIDKNNHTFNLVASSEYIVINSNPDLLNQVFHNLISNSVKYSPQNKSITIKVDLNQENVIIEFIDNGIGIPEKDLKAIFNPFFRSENVKNILGTGLGLTIVKRGIDALGGSISINSKIHIGSTVKLSLPLSNKR